MDAPIEIIGTSLTLDIDSGTSSSEARIQLEQIGKETAVKIGFISLNEERATIRIFGDFKKRENFLHKIAENKFTIQKATSLAER